MPLTDLHGDERNRSAQRSDWEYLMIIVLIALAASALLGLATGFVFRVWANAIVAPLIAFVSAIVLASHGFEFWEGVLVTVACLIVSQVAYFVGLFVESRSGIANFLTDDVFDDEPGDNREHEIDGEQEERREHPSRSPPPET
jgi:hypothetical protein